MTNEVIGTGRRKTAVASVRLKKGKGEIVVNGKKMNEYFVTDEQRRIVIAPFALLDLNDQYDIKVRVKGGGIEAQAVALRLGASRALVLEDEDRRKALKDAGYLTRDPRMKERKKYGRAGARKRFQFSKR